MTDQLPWKTIEEMEAEYMKFAQMGDALRWDISTLIPSAKGKIRPMFPGDMVLVIGDTGTGKTAFGLNCAMTCGLPAYCIQLELSHVTMFERFAARLLGVQCERLERMYAQAEGQFEYNGRGRLLATDDILFHRNSVVDVSAIESAISRCMAHHSWPTMLVWVDYIGLVKGGRGSRYERMSTIAEELKRVALDTNTIMLCTCQIHRKGDDYTTEVGLHDGKDSGSLENSCQLQWGLWRDEDDKDIILARVNKQSRGETGFIVRLKYEAEKMRITEAPAIHIDWEPEHHDYTDF